MARLATVVAGRADVVVERRVIHDEADAVAWGMAGSPTLLVDGADPFAVADQPPSVSCRLYAGHGGTASGRPSVAQLCHALDGAAGR